MNKKVLFPFLASLLSIASAAMATTTAPTPASATLTLLGHVTDASGAVIPGAHVTVETDGGRKVAEAVTDATGAYRVVFESQASKALRERIAAPGFRSSVVEGLVLTEGASRTEDIRLVAGASETVTVTSGAAIGNGQIATVAQVGILGTLDEFSTPFSVESFTDQLIRDQQAQNVTDVLQNVPGLQDVNGRYSEDAYLQFRGFALDPGATLVNGIPFMVEDRSPALEDVARVELFKGPSSLINGTGYDTAVGGSINFVTKRAADRPLIIFDGGYSSNSDFEGHLDGGRRFFSDGILGVRAQLGGRIGGTPIDRQTDHFAAAATEVDVRTEKFRASVDVMDQYRALIANRGSIYLGNATSIPLVPSVTTNPFNDASTFNKHQYFVLSHAEYDPNSHIEFFGSYGHKQSPETYQGPYSPSFSQSAGETTPTHVQAITIPFQSEEHDDVGRIGAKATFSTGPLLHQLTVSGDLDRQRTGSFFIYDPSNPANVFLLDLYHPAPTATVAGTHSPTLNNIQDTADTRNNSLAVADVITAFKGRLVLIGGLRDQSIKSTSLGSNAAGPNNNAVFTPCTSGCVYDKSRVSPSGAGLFRVTSHLSVYANYIQDLVEGQTAQTPALNAGTIFPPSVSQQEEVGAKYELAHAGATFAWFRITEPNAYINNTTQLFGLFGQQRNTGIEAEFFGNVTSSVRLLGGVTSVSAIQQNTGDASTEGARAQGAPRLELTEGAEWKVPRSRGLTLTSRVTTSSGQYAVATADPNFRVPAWARLDIGGRYTLPFKYEPTLRVNFDNVTGHNYWASGLQGLSYGTPRAVRISTGLRF